MLVVDRDNWMLYELFARYPGRRASWRAGSGAMFDLQVERRAPERWTSADAAGLPIFPGLVRYDEVVEQGEILHALRFTVPRTRRAYVVAGDATSRARYRPEPAADGHARPAEGGLRRQPFPASVQVILTR